jgi:8-hydroxy-5-deazaflavin:NADPH oxidoreductase
MKLAFIGCGNVGSALANNLHRCGHDVTLAAAAGSESQSLARAIARNAKLQVAPPSEAVRSADIVFLATPFQGALDALRNVESELAGKIIVDCTNPVGPGLSHGLKSERSGSESLQGYAAGSKVVKAFTIYGAENFEDSAYPNYTVKPAMFFCGNDQSAKATVGKLIADLGWDPLDVGGLEQALHLEHMTLLWVRMVRAKGHSPGIVWAALRR